jgi:ATP/maltotriose-dependent transcriptional regulator MalT
VSAEIGPPAGRPAPDLFEVGVIATKLAPHRLPRGSVSRPQLLDRLRAGRNRALTLVSAPAGYGKTTLLTEWVTTDSDMPFAWVTLDRGDTEPVRLWSHVIAALAHSEPAVGTRSLRTLRTGPDRVTDAVLPVLFDELSEADGNMVLILDDYHLAETAKVNAQVEAFLRYRPARVQLVIATRSDPALGVARLRASGELVEVRADSLRFDVSELSRFFDAMGVTGLTDADVSRLAERTSGWPAPLRLAALLLPEHNRDAFIDSFTGETRQVVDYLTRDVLDMLEPATKEFLLQVSVLGRMKGPLCDAVLDTSGSGAILAELERSNVFFSVDAAGEWYQQHQLFAEAMRLELVRTRPELVPILHARAAAWFTEIGDLETATDHAIAAHNVRQAAYLIAGQLHVMASTGRAATTRRWLSALSWRAAEEDPELAFVRAAAAFLDNDAERAQTHLELARTGPAELTDAAGLPLEVRIDLLEAMYGVTQVGRAEAAARRAVAATRSSAFEGIALAGLGQSLYLQGHLSEAVQALRSAVGSIPDARPLLLAVAVGNLGLAESAFGGSSRHADPMLDHLLTLLAEIGADRTPGGLIIQLAAGERDRRRGDPRAAAARFEVVIGLLEDMPRSTWLADAYLLLALVRRELGEPTRALAALGRADRVLDRLPDPGNLAERSARLRTLVAERLRRTSQFGEQLSDREIAVLRLAAAGLGQREIAEQLFISYNTVKSHLKTSYRKLGVTSRDDAVARFAALGRGDKPGAPTEYSPG